MRIFIIDTFYEPYLRNLYNKDILNRPWKQQHDAHFSGGFGTGNVYSYGLSLLGVDAIEMVVNSLQLQLAWSKEYQPELLQITDVTQQQFAILEAQIKWWKPDVIYVQDINWMPAQFLNHVKPLVSMIVGQNACPLASGIDLRYYDLLLTSLPHYVSRFKNKGVNSEYFPIGFDDRLLQKHSVLKQRNIKLSFVGGLGGFHSKGTQYLESIAIDLPLKVWGYGGEHLPIDSTLHRRWHGEAWAEDMYEILSKSLITINRHIDIAEGYANNMRLYESTGMGACLVTDFKSNLSTFFEPDREIVVYKDSFEAISKIKYLLNNPDEASSIAKRGHKRTLKDHNYRIRMIQLVSILKDAWPNKLLFEHALLSNIPLASQKILLVCSNNDIDSIPKRILNNELYNSHGSKIHVLTDAKDYNQNLNGISSWLFISEDNLDELILNCLAAIKPNLVLLLHRSPIDTCPLLRNAQLHANQKGIAIAKKRF